MGGGNTGTRGSSMPGASAGSLGSPTSSAARKRRDGSASADTVVTMRVSSPLSLLLVLVAAAIAIALPLADAFGLQPRQRQLLRQKLRRVPPSSVVPVAADADVAFNRPIALGRFSTSPPSSTAFTVLSAASSATEVESKTPPAPPHTIQILMSDTGGGHRASANALRDALDTLYPHQFLVDIVDIYTDYGPFPYNQYVPLYKIMAEYTFLWDWFYHFGATPLGLVVNELCLDLFCFDPFRECMNRFTPLLTTTDDGKREEVSAAVAKAQTCPTTNRRADMVISVHPLCQDESLKILAYLDSGGKSKKAQDRTTPFVTVVTDLGGAHPTWFNPGVDKCYVPSDALYKAALDRKVQPEQIVEYGLPIRSGFWSESGGPTRSAGETDKTSWFANTFGRGGGKDKSDSGGGGSGGGSGGGRKNKAELREELGLVQGIPTVLIVGGGDGMGGIVEQARALGKKLDADATSDPSSGDGAGPSFQMVVVCGKNERAQKDLQADDWGSGVNVDVKGFVYNMDEYMRASDAIVTKAGPGTIAEASICGLPCMLSSYLPGQEAGNVPYVEENGFGTYSGDPTTIAETVSTWLETPELLSKMQQAALEAARPAATLDIAKDIAEYLFEYKASKK